MSATGHRPPPPPRSGPAPCAAGPRPRAGPGLRSSIKIRRADGRGPSRSPTAVRRSKRGAKPGPLSTTDVLTGRALTRSIRGRRRQDASSGPGAAVDAIPPPRAGHGTSTGGSEPTGHGAVRRAEPGASTLPPARAPTGRTTRPPSRPEKQPRGAPLRLLLPPRTPTPSTGCRAACGSRPGTRVNSPGPHPQAHRVGRQQGRWAQAPAGRPPTPRPTPRRTTRSTTAASSIRPPSPAAPASSRTSSPAPRTRPTGTRPARTPSILPDVHKGIRVRRASPRAAPDHAGSPT